MRKFSNRFVRSAPAPDPLERRFDLPFEDAARMVRAARAFRKLGCRVTLGASPLTLVVTRLRAERSRFTFAIHGRTL